MSAAQYWFETTPGTNTFDITEHIRQSFWRYGLGTAWFKATRATAPYAAEARWNDLHFQFEWVPQQYLILRLPHAEKTCWALSRYSATATATITSSSGVSPTERRAGTNLSNAARRIWRGPSPSTVTLSGAKGPPTFAGYFAKPAQNFHACR
jgi:hypothetical protein